ncbi:sensor domain-containing protein [Halapricum desulfuricans]|uniref:Histidine kinase, HisKA_3 family n=1 Tax=Halapricum desulfuricans TaxID=2841257 RepID=A0A897N732_9EURY|nr:sensor domain-containing protein [Halapricum desulfuricans]QSG06859.1 Histidine kinase, HisKA_3 family [Halapricum desulfuricans]
MTRSANAGTADGSTVAGVFGVVTDAQTYRNVLYLILAFPLGLVYYVVLLFGLTLGIGLSILVVGLGVLLGTVIGSRYIAAFERRLANRLLETAIAEPDDVEPDGDGVVAVVQAYLGAASTWKGLAFAMLKFWLGVLAFVLLVSFLGVGIELSVLPLAPDGLFNVQVANWRVAESFETTTQRALAVPTGLLLVLVSLHVLNAAARINAAIASSLLGAGDDRTQGRNDGQSDSE